MLPLPSTGTKGGPPGPIDEEIPDCLFDPGEVVGHHLPEPDYVPELLGLDPGDHLPGLID